MLDAAEADRHPNSNVVTRAIGVVTDLKIDTVSGDALAGDQFLLASDGLTRLIEDAELRAILLAMQPAEAVEKLIDTVLERGAPDNVSIILVKVA